MKQNILHLQMNLLKFWIISGYRLSYVSYLPVTKLDLSLKEGNFVMWMEKWRTSTLGAKIKIAVVKILLVEREHSNLVNGYASWTSAAKKIVRVSLQALGWLRAQMAFLLE